MISISFNLPEKYLSKKSQIEAKINGLKGDFHNTQTKDGTVFIIDFQNDSNARIFDEWLTDLIPDIADY